MSNTRYKENLIVLGSDTSESDYSEAEWEVDPAQFAPPSPVADYHLPEELVPGPEQPFDEDSDEEDNTHIGLWREGDLGSLVLALNYHRDDLKGKFVGSHGGKEKKKAAWLKVAEYVNTRCGTSWSVPQCKTKLVKYTQVIKAKVQRLRTERNKSGRPADTDGNKQLSEIEEMFLDYVGVEGVVGVPGIHGVSLIPDEDQTHLDRRQQEMFEVWDYKRESKPAYDELPGGRLRLKTPSKTPRKTPSKRSKTK